MANENLDAIIEKYKRELVDFDRSARTAWEAETSASTESDEAVETVVGIETEEAVERAETVPVQPNADGIVQENTENIQMAELIETAPGNGANSGGSVTSRTEYDVPADTGSNEYSPYFADHETEYESYEQFIAQNPQNGFLRIQAFAAEEAIPISNARVLVTCRINGNDRLFYDRLTDSNGVVFGLLLPAPDKELSSYPTALRPYALYDVEISHPEFIKAYFKGVLIFDSIETVQMAQLIPASPAPPIQEEIVISEERREEE